MVGCIEHENLNPFVSAVGRTIEIHSLIAPGQRVLVALSGGADSVGLLAALVKLNQAGLGAKLIVAHLDHGLRPQSQSDCQFARELTQQFGLEFISRQVDVKALADAKGLGIEEAARGAGLRVLNLDVRETQEAAIKLYDSLDYRRWGMHPHYAWLDGRWVTGYFYHKDLTVNGSRQ